MQIRRLTAKDEERIIAFLQPHIQTSMFMLGNISKKGIGYKTERFCGDYVGLFNNEDTLQGVVSYYYPGRIMYQVPKHQDYLKPMLQLLLDTQTERPIVGIIGEATQAHIIKDLLQIPANAFQMDDIDDAFILKNEALITNPLPEGFTIKQITEMDKDTLLNWQISYDAEALGCDITPHIKAENKEQIEGYSKETLRWVLYKEETPVSFAGFNATYANYKQVGPVFTPKEHRGNGYAGMLLSEMIAQAAARGTETVFLFTNTEQAARSYKKIGFKQEGQFALFLLKEPFMPNIEEL